MSHDHALSAFALFENNYVILYIALWDIRLQDVLFGYESIDYINTYSPLLILPLIILENSPSLYLLLILPLCQPKIWTINQRLPVYFLILTESLKTVVIFPVLSNKNALVKLNVLVVFEL